MRKKGFTLIELMIVIAILGILAALLMGNFFTSLKKSRDAKRKADLQQVQNALELYYEDKKTYPNSGNIFDLLVYTAGKLCETSACGANEKIYMQKLPSDPKSSQSYEYKYDPTTLSYKLYACLENKEQILPYQISGSTSVASFCTTQCYYPDTSAKVNCIWGITSSNTAP